MDSRLITSGMTEGRLNTSGMTECLLWSLCHARRYSLCYSHRSSLSCPPVSLCHTRRAPLCHSRWLLAGIQCFFVPYLCMPAWENHGFPINNVGNDRREIEHVGHDGMPALVPLSCPTVLPLLFPPILSVMPDGLPLSYPPAPPLSYPPVVSGNPVFFWFLICVCLHGKTMDSRLITSGMTEGRLNTSGMTEGLLWSLCYALTTPHPGPLPQGERETSAPLSCPPVSLCHSRWSPSVIPAGC